MFLNVISTPLGLPVVPDVYIINAVELNGLRRHLAL
jgi:hypothetical protein